MDNLEASKQADISLLRIVATLAVVFLHTNNTLSNNSLWFSLTEDQTVFFTANNLLMNWAVPVFLMITGGLLLDPNRKITYDICIKKYVKRILLALFVFGVSFSIMEITLNVKALSVGSIGEAIINVINGNSWSHLWYLYSLIGLYLILPILKTFINNTDNSTLICSIGVIFLFCFMIKWIDKILGTTIAFGIPIAGFSVFYALIGRYIIARKSYFLDKKKICACLLVLETVVIIISSVCFYPQSKELMGYDSPLIAVFSITIFCLFIGNAHIIDFTTTKMDLLWKIDRLCFGVYLIHPVLINFVYKFMKFTPVKFGSIYPVITLGFWIFFVVGSFIGAWLMNQIPILKKYIL